MQLLLTNQIIFIHGIILAVAVIPATSYAKINGLALVHVTLVRKGSVEVQKEEYSISFRLKNMIQKSEQNIYLIL